MCKEVRLFRSLPDGTTYTFDIVSSRQVGVVVRFVVFPPGGTTYTFDIVSSRQVALVRMVGVLSNRATCLLRGVFLESW